MSAFLHVLSRRKKARFVDHDQQTARHFLHDAAARMELFTLIGLKRQIGGQGI